MGDGALEEALSPADSAMWPITIPFPPPFFLHFMIPW